MSTPSRRSLLIGAAALGAGWAAGLAWGHRPLPARPAVFLGAPGLATLTAAFEALLPDGAPFEEVAADVDAFLATSDPDLGGQLVLALTALEHLGGFAPWSLRRFSRLDRAERLAVIEGWRVSRFGPKRQIADAVRRVALFSWYTRPGVWAGIGYDGPWVR